MTSLARSTGMSDRSTAAGHLVTRPLTLADVPAMNEILGEAERHEPAEMHFDETELTERLESPTARLAQGSVAVLDTSRSGPDDPPELVGFDVLDMIAGPDVVKFFMLGGVRTHWLRRGIGRRIVAAQLANARRLADAEHFGVPAEVRMWLADGRPATAALSEATGFRTRRWFLDMRHELGFDEQSGGDATSDGSPATGRTDGTAGADRVLSADLELTGWTDELDDQVHQVSNVTFADHWGSLPMDRERWRSEFAESSLFRPGCSLLALRAGRVVGFVLAEESEAETAARGYRTAYIARVGTLRQERGRGVASALLREVLHTARHQGYRAAELGVDAESPTGAGRLYERLGFREIRRNRMASIDLPPGPAGDGPAAG